MNSCVNSEEPELTIIVIRAQYSAGRMTIRECKHPLFGRRVELYSSAMWERSRDTFWFAALSRALRLGRRLTAVFALLSCSCRAEGRSGSPARRAGRSRGGPGNAAYVAVQARLITGARSSSDWTAPSVLRLPGEAPIANQGHGHADVLEHLERAADSSLQLQP
jgi:hypothetical protein